MNNPDTPPAAPGRAGKVSETIIRILCGLSYVVFGLNLFLNFIPQPKTPIAPEAAAFIGALMQTGYMIKLIGATQLVTGALLLVNRFVPLALTLIAPFLVNSLAFHLCLEHTGLPMAVIFCAFEVFLAWRNRAAFRPILTARL